MINMFELTIRPLCASSLGHKRPRGRSQALGSTKPQAKPRIKVAERLKGIAQHELIFKSSYAELLIITQIQRAAMTCVDYIRCSINM